MKKSDICYYISVNKEENSSFVVSNNGSVPSKQLESALNNGQFIVFIIIFNSITKTSCFISWLIMITDKPVDDQKTIRESYTLQSKQTEETPIVGNHLSIPKPMDMNPNLLSPEVLGQRRGRYSNKL